jgi:hypothetical protein
MRAAGRILHGMFHPPPFLRSRENVLVGSELRTRRKEKKKMEKKAFQKTRITWAFRPTSRVKQSGKLYKRNEKHRRTAQ